MKTTYTIKAQRRVEYFEYADIVVEAESIEDARALAQDILDQRSEDLDWEEIGPIGHMVFDQELTEEIEAVVDEDDVMIEE